MNDPRKSVRLIRIACWILGGVVFGAILGEIINAQRMPGRPKGDGAAEIMVAAGDRAGEQTALSSTHAALALRNSFLTDLPGSLRIDPEKLRQHVRIKAEEDGTRIIVEVPEIPKNHQLATAIATLFRGIDHERRLLTYPATIPPFSEEDRKLATDALKLRGLLDDQAARAGFVDFLQVLPKAIHGSAKAKSLAENEDFSRRLRRFSEISVALGLDGVPGAPLTSAPDVVFEARFVEEHPGDGKPWLTANTVSIACVLVGLTGAFLSGRKKQPSVPPGFPAPVSVDAG